jgi:dolichyl-phosphate-mannose-protein mannosyltransferase
MKNIKRKRQILLLALAGILVAASYAFRLGFPPEPYFDETYYVNFVRELVNQSHYSTALSAHPPLAHLCDAFLLILLGDKSWVWRLSSLFSGLGVLVLIFLITRKLTQNIFISCLAVFFFFVDGISITQARIQMPNALMLLLSLAAIYCFLQYSLGRHWKKEKALLLSGIFIGLALTTKLTAVSWLILLIILVLIEGVVKKEKSETRVADFFVFFILLPVLVYFACHLFIPFLRQNSWADIWSIQITNLHYHLAVAPTQTHGYSSAWWGWPLILRPIWYYYQNNAGMIEGILCIGNPLVLWAFPLAFVYTLIKFIKDRRGPAGFILLGFLTQWLFFALGKRMKFFHYYYNDMPFVAMGLAAAVAAIWSKGTWGKILVVFYLLLVAIMFLYWYPLLTGYPVSEDYYRQHMWFPAWI